MPQEIKVETDDHFSELVNLNVQLEGPARDWQLFRNMIRSRTIHARTPQYIKLVLMAEPSSLAEEKKRMGKSRHLPFFYNSVLDKIEETPLFQESVILDSVKRLGWINIEIKAKVLEAHDEDWDSVTTCRLKWSQRLRLNRTIVEEPKFCVPCIQVKLDDLQVQFPPVLLKEDVETSKGTYNFEIVTTLPDNSQIDTKSMEQETAERKENVSNSFIGFTHLLFLLLYAWSVNNTLCHPGDQRQVWVFDFSGEMLLGKDEDDWNEVAVDLRVSRDGRIRKPLRLVYYPP